MALLACITWRYRSCSICNDQLFNLRLFLDHRSQHERFLNDIERSADRYLAYNWQIKRALPAHVSVMSNYYITITSFPIHIIPLIFSESWPISRSNTAFCSNRKRRLFLLSVLLNLLTANQKPYLILVTNMRKLFYYPFCVVVVTCHWFCGFAIKESYDFIWKNISKVIP